MSLFLGFLIGLLTIVVSQNPGGGLWRKLVEAPARMLNRITWRHVAVVVLTLILLEVFVQMAMPHMAVVLAVDIVGWIDVLAATVVVTRVLPGWRAFKVSLRRVLTTVGFVRPRAPRARRIRRPAATSDDADPAFGYAFA